MHHFHLEKIVIVAGWKDTMMQTTTSSYRSSQIMDEHCFTPWDSADKESDCYEWEGVKYNITTGRVID